MLLRIEPQQPQLHNYDHQHACFTVQDVLTLQSESVSWVVHTRLRAWSNTYLTMRARMDTWIRGWMNGWMDGRSDGWMDEWIQD